jgi:hypothetical protein
MGIEEKETQYLCYGVLHHHIKTKGRPKKY